MSYISNRVDRFAGYTSTYIHYGLIHKLQKTAVHYYINYLLQ